MVFNLVATHYLRLPKFLLYLYFTCKKKQKMTKIHVNIRFYKMYRKLKVTIYRKKIYYPLLLKVRNLNKILSLKLNFFC